MVPKTDPSFLNLYFQETKKKPRSSSCLPFYVLFVKRSRAWGTTDLNALLQPKKGTRTIVSFVLPFKLNRGESLKSFFFANISFFFLFFTIFLSCRKKVILQSKFGTPNLFVIFLPLSFFHICIANFQKSRRQLPNLFPDKDQNHDRPYWFSDYGN